MLTKMLWFLLIFFSTSIIHSEKKIIDLEKPLLTGAFIDPNKITQYTEKDYILPEIPPFSWLIKNPKVTKIISLFIRMIWYSNELYEYFIAEHFIHFNIFWIFFSWKRESMKVMKMINPKQTMVISAKRYRRRRIYGKI